MRDFNDDINYVGGLSDSIGFFSWVLADNLLFADAVFASLYEIPLEDLVKGMPVEAILSRIVEEDRAMIARNTHEAIISGNTSASSYAVQLKNGGRKCLVAYGRCLRDSNGEPSVFTGAVMDAVMPDVTFGSSALEAHCRAAYEIANRNGDDLAARYLKSALALVSGS
ncbi:PAS domain-containing protein [Agrobacterium tumefaciens]|uniref:PAS fold-3 domain-containing protein n=1 Tax=Agrobacterium tumefaciens TaxID=358 RepID=A0A176X1C3_AGRTU|nr:PAS domain-containing protein [Agrobacterium tumefaciens]OAE40464.1 hypothetical protein A7J57_09255 [Agrobacterium tumefaciens]